MPVKSLRSSLPAPRRPAPGRPGAPRRPAAPRRPGTSNVAILLLLAFLPLAGRSLAAAPAEVPPLVESVDVEVVNVEAVVVDGKGNPVTGLTADDFEVYQDGSLQPVTNFYAFHTGTAVLGDEAPGDAVPEAPGLRRRMALLFDANSLGKRDRDRALEGLEQFILEQFDGSYEWSVVAYGRDLQLVQPFTSDKTRVLAALSRVRDLPVPVVRPFSTSILSEDPATNNRLGSGGNTVGLDQGPRGGSGPMRLTRQQFEVRERVMASLDVFKRTTAALLETMSAYSAYPGRKSLVLVSGVIETLPSASQLIHQAYPGIGPSNANQDPMLRSLQNDLHQMLDAVVTTANASGFAIYPLAGSAFSAGKSPHLDVATRTQPVSQNLVSVVTPQNDLESSPRTMAAGTGGEFISTTRYYNAFDWIDDQTANSYVLGFATDHAPDAKYHRIEVKVKRPGLQVRSRHGYLHLSAQERAVQALASPLSFPKDQGELVVDVAVAERQARDRGPTTLTVTASMPLQDITLVPRQDRMAGRVHMYLAIYDEEGEVVDILRRHQDLDVAPKALEQVDGAQPVRFGFKFDLKPGSYTVAVTLLDEVTQRSGTGFEKLSV
ncbi:MAG TPA: VWA domain-containing protein [Thermoanaerobaculia bacterium]|nr:VWA domain-containing protein [Thermoanaerobaculia bacterium]